MDGTNSATAGFTPADSPLPPNPPPPQHHNEVERLPPDLAAAAVAAGIAVPENVAALGAVVSAGVGFSHIELNSYGTEVAAMLHALSIRTGIAPFIMALQLTANSGPVPPEYMVLPIIRLLDQGQSFLATPALAYTMGLSPVPSAAVRPPPFGGRCCIAICRNADNPHHECNRFCVAAISCPNRFNPYHWCVVACSKWIPSMPLPRIRKPMLAKPPAKIGRPRSGHIDRNDYGRRSARSASRRTYTEDEYDWLDRIEDDGTGNGAGGAGMAAGEGGGVAAPKARMIMTQTRAQRDRQ